MYLCQYVCIYVPMCVYIASFWISKDTKTTWHRRKRRNRRLRCKLRNWERGGGQEEEGLQRIEDEVERIWKAMSHNTTFTSSYHRLSSVFPDEHPLANAIVSLPVHLRVTLCRATQLCACVRLCLLQCVSMSTCVCVCLLNTRTYVCLVGHASVCVCLGRSAECLSILA